MARILILGADSRPFIADMAAAFRGVQSTDSSPRAFKCEHIVTPLTSTKSLSAPGAKTEPFSPQFDLDVSKTRALEARFESIGIDGHQSVTDVNQP